jgi:hypothetical protein
LSDLEVTKHTELENMYDEDAQGELSAFNFCIEIISREIADQIQHQNPD